MPVDQVKGQVFKKSEEYAWVVFNLQYCALQNCSKLFYEGKSPSPLGSAVYGCFNPSFQQSFSFISQCPLYFYYFSLCTSLSYI